MGAPNELIRISAKVQPQTIAADLLTVIARAPFRGVVTNVLFVANATMTGQATNNRTLTLYNRAGTGTGTVVVATLPMSSAGASALVCLPKVIPLSATPANLIVAQGDVLQWESLHILTGIVDEGGIVLITITPFVGVDGN